MSSAVAPPPMVSHYQDSSYAPDPAQSPDEDDTRAGQPVFALGNGAPPNTPSSALLYSNPSTAMSTPRAQQPTPSAQPTPTSASSAIKQEPDALDSSPYSDRQDSARTSAPYNTPELPTGFDSDRSKEDAGSTPGVGPQKQEKKKVDRRIFTEPPAFRPVPDQSARPPHSRSVGDLTRPLEDDTIINRLVITDPREDIDREQARVADSQPMSQINSPVTGLGLVTAEPVQQQVHQPEPVQQNVQQTPPVQQQRSRQEHLKNPTHRRETKFGDYILGQTIGEGEFGKVKLGWKKDAGIQVAIKLIGKESLGSHPNRLPKIYREIAILRGLQHPNIVRLHEMVETEFQIGIILEYASGGELFDHILNQRYLKDHSARRLFAQLVSGVGYLHMKGIVHRDLKLENLLLDRNKNIIITDFGFANTFNPADELSDEIEYNLSNKDYVQRAGLEQISHDGFRRGDLMQTSCGSPCYAAPELVVSDSLYTGRKVDVWSCGVILYAMLAGYLPFDDDPANPDGDNINLLYKYIVSTPLTFPEYVTPHARDLLRRILVPDPRKRADLFEVARHSWLSDYANVVSFITSAPTAAAPAITAPAPADAYDAPVAAGLGRSASVRETTKSSPIITPAARSPHMSEDRAKKERDAKRMTVQLEYVAPQSATAREPAQTRKVSQPTTRSRGNSGARTSEPSILSASAPAIPPASSSNQRPISMAQPARTVRVEIPRTISDTTTPGPSPITSSAARPSTRGSVGAAARMPSRGNSYGQPAAATVAPTNAEGRFSQPQRNSLILTGPAPTEDPEPSRPMSQQFTGDMPSRPAGDAARNKHKRTSTVESITQRFFGRSNSTRRQSQAIESRPKRESRQYPPVSIKNADPEFSASRRSVDSRRSSVVQPKKEDEANKRASKRFSFIPSAFSRMSLSAGSWREDTPASDTSSKRASMQPPPRPTSKARHDSKVLTGASIGSPREPTSPSVAPTAFERPRTMPAPAGPQRGVTSPDLSFAPQSPKRPQSQQQAPASPQRGQNTLQKPHRNFREESGARRVMNWFRSRGRERGG